MLKFLGDGAFAKVYKARHRTLGYVRAIKVSSQYIEDEESPAYRSFLRECSSLLRLGSGAHPNIVRMFNPRLVDHSALVEMDFIDGETLCRYIDREIFVPADEVMRFAREIVGALAFCHCDVYRFLMDPNADGIARDPDDADRLLIDDAKRAELIERYRVIHNDLHSNNIMRRRYDGRYMLLDFGLAISQSECIKSSQRRAGAAEYQAPEKITNQPITPASDVYSLGVLLYEMLAGRVPFQMAQRADETPEAAVVRIQQQHLQQTPPDPLELRRRAFESKFPGQPYVDDLPEGFAELVMRCLSKNPHDRFEDAAELYDRLMQLQDGSEGTAAARQTNDALEQRNTSLERECASLQRENSHLQETMDSLQQEKDSLLKAYWTLENKYRRQSVQAVESADVADSSVSTFFQLLVILAAVAAAVWVIYSFILK